jgi:phosphoribosylanthranilate isomerase
MWIKICGLKNVEDALAIAECGADAIGLNFYEPSVRCVDIQTARQIVEHLNGQAEPIGLFVNHSLEQIMDIVDATGIRSVQLHGDETPRFLASLQLAMAPDGPVNLYRAFRIDAQTGCQPMAAYLSECKERGVQLVGCLVDSFIPGEYGGTGHTAPWDLLAEQYDSGSWPPLIVAGGLTASNVSEAIRVTAPFGVDVASGVEVNKGVKDLGLVRDFIQRARQANS